MVSTRFQSNAEERVVYLITARRQLVERVSSVSELPGLSEYIVNAVVVDNRGRERRFERHINPYKSEAGGFVEDTAHVEETAFVDMSSSVEENADVAGNARILRSRVYGTANVKDRAVLYRSEAFDSVKIGGESMIRNSSISGDLSYYDVKMDGKFISTRAY